jgi:hypothetical protein
MRSWVGFRPGERGARPLEVMSGVHLDFGDFGDEFRALQNADLYLRYHNRRTNDWLDERSDVLLLTSPSITAYGTTLSSRPAGCSSCIPPHQHCDGTPYDGWLSHPIHSSSPHQCGQFHPSGVIPPNTADTSTRRLQPRTNDECTTLDLPSTAMAHVCLGLVPCAHDLSPKVSCDGRVTSGAAWYSHVASISRYLSSRMQVQIGDRVALLAYNTDEFLEALLGCTDAGAICCPLNWRWSATEVSMAMRTITASVLLVDHNCWHLASDLDLPDTVTVVLVSALGEQPSTAPAPKHILSTAQLLGAHPAAQLQLLRPASDAAVICFTSGEAPPCPNPPLHPCYLRWVLYARCV